MKLYIKNMVCNRCIMVVKAELETLSMHVQSISLGEVEVNEPELSFAQKQLLIERLTKSGFELIDDHKSRIIEKIKNVVVTLIHYDTEQPKQKHSELIAGALHYDYPYLSKLFSEIEGITIEQYVIQQKVEKIKEYIVYDELSLSEISYRMGYSSIAHLSSQFKKVTGLPPSHFKNIGANLRKPLDKVGKL